MVYGALGLAAAAFIIVYQQMEKTKRLEKRIEELEDKLNV